MSYDNCYFETMRNNRLCDREHTLLLRKTTR